jgi:hypothetical protein
LVTIYPGPKRKIQNSPDFAIHHGFRTAMGLGTRLALFCALDSFSQAVWLGLGEMMFGPTARTGDYPSDRASYFRQQSCPKSQRSGQSYPGLQKGGSDDDPEDATRQAKKEISKDLPR